MRVERRERQRRLTIDRLQKMARNQECRDNRVVRTDDKASDDEDDDAGEEESDDEEDYETEDEGEGAAKERRLRRRNAYMPPPASPLGLYLDRIATKVK
jgi:hypothetical protein